MRPFAALRRVRDDDTEPFPAAATAGHCDSVFSDF
jgi:hypothetical protein